MTTMSRINRSDLKKEYQIFDNNNIANNVKIGIIKIIKSSLFNRLYFKIRLNTRIISVLYNSNLADLGSYIEKEDGHYFTKTLNNGKKLEYSFTVNRNGTNSFKLNEIIIVFHPSIQIINNKRMYIANNSQDVQTLYNQIKTELITL
jgi:hypothetical protein